jgi:hypothetical protein
MPASDARPPNPEKLGVLSDSTTGLKLYSTVYFLSANWRYVDAKKTDIIENKMI